MEETADGEIVCIGEILWDSLPLGLFLGGAPFNVAYHLHRLGEPAVMASRVGEDRLGVEALRRMEWKGMSPELMQRDDTDPTGFVEVTLDTEGVPEYTIVRPAAWDRISRTDALVERVSNARALVYGSLAQRSPTSRHTIQQLCQADTLRVFDVNLRPPFDDRAVVAQGLEHGDLIKLNEDELDKLAVWFDWTADEPAEQIKALSAAFGCRTVCVTRGAAGAVLMHDGEWTEHPGMDVDVVDTVGAGDAFLATLLSGLLQGLAPAEMLTRANRMGAYLATCLGATPEYDPETVLETSF